MKILLLNPPFRSDYIRSARSTWPTISGSNWYPIFLAYAAGWLEKHGHEINLVDALVDGLTIDQTCRIAREFNPELLVLYVSEQSLKSDVAIGTKIKKLTSCQLVLVGPWCAPDPEKILSAYKNVDIVVRREFDDVALDLANKKNINDIKGLVYRDGKKIKSTGEREFLTSKQLDEFPFVTEYYKRFLPIRKYHQASLLNPFVDLFTGRGCSWGKCTFCLWPNTIHKGAPSYRMRSLSNVIEELKFIKKELPYVKEVFIQDDTLPAGRARMLSELIIKNKLKIAWACYARADMDLKTLKLMKKAGCRYIHVGYESLNKTVLQNMNKGTNLEYIDEFTENTKKAGIRVQGDFIIGLPGETEETIKRTIEWAKKLGIEGYQFFIPQPQKGTPLYDWLKKKGYMTKNGDINYPHLSYEQLNYWRFKAMRELYFTPGYVINTLKNIDSAADLYRLLRTALHVVPNILKK